MKLISLGVIMFPSKATNNLTKTLVLGMGNLPSSCWSWESKSPQNNTNYCCRKHTHFGHRTWRNAAGKDLEASILRTMQVAKG